MSKIRCMASEVHIWSVGKLSLSCLRNMAFHRAGRYHFVDGLRGSFWNDVHNNFFYVAVLEWCKLFNEGSEEYRWRRVVEAPEEFYRELLDVVGVDGECFTRYEQQIHAFRNGYVAHTNDGTSPTYPDLEPMRKSVSFLFDYVKRTNGKRILRTDVPDAESYWSRMLEEASTVYKEYLR